MAAQRRCREVTGPGPCSVAVRAKPPKEQRNENFVLARRQKEKELLENTNLIKLFDQYCKVYRWQQHKEQKWLNSAVQRKVDETMQEYLAGIDERRVRLCELLEAEESRYCTEMEALEETAQEKQAKMKERAKVLKEKREGERQQLVAEKREQQFRLCELLEAEESRYCTEMEALEETAQEKQAKMKERAKVLKEKREGERQQLVAEKREQQFREQSEELRTLWMKKHQKEVFEDQLAQVALKEELEKQQKKEEQMLEELLKEDMLAKEKQEAVKMQKVAEQNWETLNALNAQVAVLKAHKEEAKRLKEEEALLLKEEQQLLKLENEQLQMEKLQKQRECRDMLLRAAQDRKNRLNEENQVELALEMKILEKALQDPPENIEKARRKQELLKEQKTYLAHLAQQLEEENQRQKEVDKIIDEEIAKIWDKKAEQLRLEKEARKQLLNDVLNTRQLQIEEKLQRNVKKQEELAQEKKLLAEAITKLRQTEEEKYARLCELLEAEESRYCTEMEALEETAQEKQAKMKERAKVLKEKREGERQQLVAEKREQQFREQSEELRTLWMKKHQKEVFEDQLAQVALKEELEKQQKKEEQMLEELLKEDMLAKEKQEAVKMQKVAEQNWETLNALNAQVAVLKAHKEEAKRLKEEEALLLKEEQQLLKLENEQLQMEKLQKQRECRDMLLRAAQDRKNRLNEENQVELALEMKILEKALQDAPENIEKARRKQELLKEQKTYLAHLAQQLEEENQRQKEVDKIIDEEIAKIWDKKAEQLRLEKEARKQLLNDVLNTRQLQIEEKLQRNVKKQEELAQEKKLLAEAITKLRQTEEEKYARLCELLEAEESRYCTEMEALEETAQEKQAKMKERAKVLKEKREGERQQLVAEKREQQFREQSEELRTLWMKKHQKEVFEDQLAQVALKEELEKQQKKEEQMLEELLKEDMLAKEKQEAVKMQKVAEQNWETLNALNAQVAVLKAHKEEAKRLKEEEALLLKEEQQLLKLENEQLQMEKLQKQRECRDMLLRAAQDRKNRLNEENQVELALEMKILEKALQDPPENIEKARRKQELLKEQKTYLAHLAQQLEEENQRQKEVDKIIDEEIAKIWDKKAEQLRLEKEARKQLLNDVLNTRQLQIEEKLQRNVKKQEELAQEKKLLAEAITKLRQTEEEKYARLCELLEAEESRYCTEMEALEETAQEKQAKMKERAKVLKEKREGERQQLVAEKREQQFREQSEELRTLWMKKHQKEVFEDQLAQVALKEELEKQQKKEEQMLEELLKEDMLAKEKQEAVKMQKVAEQNWETLNALNAQVAVLKAHKEEAKRLKEEEALLLKEEQQLLKLENEQLQMEKLQKQRECRDMLLRAAQDRKNRLNEENQVELALEMKILEKALQDPPENIEKARRKQELLKEQKTYLAHLAQQLEEENQRQKEVDKIIDEEIAKIWDKKAEQLRLEKEARKQLLNDVLNTRQLQIEEKLQRNVKKQEELAQEKKLLAEAITKLRQTEEEKYARLCELLEAEESRYCTEMEALEETAQEKQAKMKERAKVLKEKREGERQQLVAEKREQQFREQSEELRTLWMKKHQKEVFEDQLAQVALKEELEKQQKKEEQMLEELLKEDMLAKEKQEAVKMQKVAEQNWETLNALNAQVAVLKAHKEEAKRLKEEEALLLKEEQQLLKLENEQLQMEKLQKQRECRDMLLRAAQDRKNRLNEENQVELALEMKILEKALQDPPENIEKARRKQELLKEQKTYLAHLAQQLEEENQRQKEVDKIIDEEIAKIWDKKAEQLRLEKEARKQLLNDVLNTRQLQIEEKLQRNVKKQEELAQEKKLLAEAITKLRQTEEEKYARKVKEAKEYKEQLRAQMAYQQQARDAEQEEKQQDYELSLEAERAYQEKQLCLFGLPLGCCQCHGLNTQNGTAEHQQHFKTEQHKKWSDVNRKLLERFWQWGEGTAPHTTLSSPCQWTKLAFMPKER
ncbi:uncharacterized protein AAGF69_016604 isoform 10-T11 [Amazona ochrocephala]